MIRYQFVAYTVSLVNGTTSNTGFSTWYWHIENVARKTDRKLRQAAMLDMGVSLAAQRKKWTVFSIYHWSIRWYGLSFTLSYFINSTGSYRCRCKTPLVRTYVSSNISESSSSGTIRVTWLYICSHRFPITVRSAVKSNINVLVRPNLIYVCFKQSW